MLQRPDPALVKQHLCLDKGYDNPTGQTVCDQVGYIAHIRE